MPIVNKFELAKYMISEHWSSFDKIISPIKLQKGLYFLYAFWGGKIRSAQFEDENGDSMIEDIELYSTLDEHLFEADFEAWAYGPVDRDIYVWFKELTLDEKNKIRNIDLDIEDCIKLYLKDLLNRIFNSNDFGLVDLSHEDRCWREVYNPTRKNKMDSEAIITEYAQ